MCLPAARLQRCKVSYLKTLQSPAEIRRRHECCELGLTLTLTLACGQVVLVSATLPHEVLEMTHKFMSEPLRVLVKRDELTLEAWPLHRLASHHLKGFCCDDIL